MAFGDNFMWDPDKAIEGESSDGYFNALGAFEIVSFNFGIMPEGMTIEQPKTGGGEGGGGGESKTGRSMAGMNAGLMGGVKMGGTVSKRLGGGGGSSTGGGEAGSSGGGSRGKPKFGTLTVVKYVDSASPTIYQYCSTGGIIPTMNIAIRKSGGDPLLYLQYCLRYNQITGVTWNGGEGDKHPAETFTLEFKAMGMQYISQTSRGSYTGKPKTWLWSVETMESTGKGDPTLEIGGEMPKDPVFLEGIVGKMPPGSVLS